MDKDPVADVIEIVTDAIATACDDLEDELTDL
jgi:hypothetical protein